MSVERQREKTP